MIVRKLYWCFLLSSIFASTIAEANNDEYEENDWVPIQPTRSHKAEGRVLNLDPPSQNFFPDEHYQRKRPIHQQYFEETSPPKRQKPKHEPFKFQSVPTQYHPQPQFAPLPKYVPRPVPNQQLMPPQSSHDYYSANNAPSPVAVQDLLGPLESPANVKAIQLPPAAVKPKEEKETVQLLYVPVENLNHPPPPPPQPKPQVEPFIAQNPIPYVAQPQSYIPERAQYVPQKQHIESDFINQALAAHRLQQQFQLGQPIVLQTTTTPAPKPTPKKRKPHQPPLAVYMEKQGQADVSDVLDALKQASSISVQDNIGPESPKIFVGPSNLEPSGYAKFPLPYLSNVQGNRIERRVENLPFFVAPLSYKTPDGYSKIPLPSPHVGSVVVSNKHQVQAPPQNQLVPEFAVKNQFQPQQDYFEHKHLQRPQETQFYQSTPKYTDSYEAQSIPQDNRHLGVAQIEADAFQQIASFIGQTPPVTETQKPLYQKAQDQVIDQYEIEQINQFVEPKPERSTTQVPQHEEYVPTPRARTRSRPRARVTTTTTTPAPDYTRVLEQFSAPDSEESARKPEPTYRTDVETIPAKVYKLEPSTTEGYLQPSVESLEPLLYNRGQSLPNRAPSPEPDSIAAPQYENTRHNIYEPFLEQTTPRDVPFNVKHQEYFPTRKLPQTSVELYEAVKTEDQDKDFVNLRQTVPNSNPELVLEDKNVQDPTKETLYQVFPQEQNVQYEAQSEELNPYLPELINGLQNQAVKPLLMPGLLVPTTDRQTYHSTEAVATASTTTTTEAPKVETTTRRSRGRQRGNSRHTTTTSTPRRTVAGRRRTTQKPATDRQFVVRTTSTEVPQYDPTRKTGQRQRFRTRGRPLAASTEAVTTETVQNLRVQATEKVFKQPRLEGGFKALSGDPLSYMQFDNIVENQHVITVKPGRSEETGSRDYHQLYDLPRTEASPVAAERSSSYRPTVDVQIAHVPEPQIITRPDTQFIKVGTNFQYADNDRTEEPSTKASTSRARIRSRGRTTTTRPVAAPKTRTHSSESKESEEFYGFIRTPNFSQQQSTTSAPIPQYSSSYREAPRTIINLEESSEENASLEPIQFVGEIRPKYASSTESLESTEVPKFRNRARIRVPNKKTDNSNEVKDDAPARRSGTVTSRGRSRGKAHYKVPETSQEKRDPDHDVEGGNYPIGFLKGRGESPSEKPATFQITIDPYEEEDQVPHSSINVPQVVKNPNWVEASNLPPFNHIDIDTKKLFPVESPTTTEENFDTTVVTTTEPVKPTHGRRGVWKLVRHTPVEPLDSAESQNYYSSANAADSSDKENKEPVTTTEGGILGSLYNMFSFASVDKPRINNSEERTTTESSPTFPQEITDQPGTTSQDDATEVTTKQHVVEPWEMRQVKTSTSTEVSHETEICYKGKCVKSKEKGKKKE